MRRALLAVRGESTNGRVASAALLVVDGVPRHRLPPRALRSPHFHSAIWKFARSGTLRVNTHARGRLYFHHGLLALVLLLLQTAPARALDVPKLERRVTDLAGILTHDQIAALEAKLRDFEASDSTQIAVLVLPSLQGEVLEDYSMRAASAWRGGQKGRDNGALLLVAMKERKVRIEVGYGLEPTLTDARSRQIIQNEIVPRFRAGAYYEGIDGAVSAMIQTVRGTYNPAPLPARAPSPRRSSGDYLHWIVFLFFPLLWIVGALGTLGAGLVGAGAGAFLMYLLAGAFLPLVAVGGLGGFLAGILLGRMARAASGPGHHRIGTRGSGWYPGGGFSGFSGSSFGGDSSSEGFSGGGGDFGGGGSSGSW